MNLHLNKIMKASIIAICLFCILSNFSLVFATGGYYGGYDVSGQFGGDPGAISEHVPTVRKILTTILDVVRLVGAGIALIILMYIGVKFMMAAPSERANIKQYLTNYVIGAFILLGASGILTIIQKFTANTIK